MQLSEAEVSAYSQFKIFALVKRDDTIVGESHINWSKVLRGNVTPLGIHRLCIDEAKF